MISFTVPTRDLSLQRLLQRICFPQPGYKLHAGGNGKHLPPELLTWPGFVRLRASLRIGYTQYIAMMVLWEHKTMNVKAMGDILYLDSGTMTPVLKKLESKGFITRQRSTTDERNLVVTITEAGEALKEKAVAVPAEIAKCSNLEPEEATMLYRILYKILGNKHT